MRLHAHRVVDIDRDEIIDIIIYGVIIFFIRESESYYKSCYKKHSRQQHQEFFYLFSLTVLLLYRLEDRGVAEINDFMSPEIEEMNDNRDYQCEERIKHIWVKKFHHEKFRCKDKKSQRTTDNF